MPSQKEWEALSLEAQEDRRKGKRVPHTYPVEVSGLDPAGRLFSERTVTTNVSETGCCFQVKTRLERGAVVAIKLLSRQKETPHPAKAVLFQIIWVAPDADGLTVGTLKLQQEQMWNLAFPPKNLPKHSPK